MTNLSVSYLLSYLHGHLHSVGCARLVVHTYLSIGRPSLSANKWAVLCPTVKYPLLCCYLSYSCWFFCCCCFVSVLCVCVLGQGGWVNFSVCYTFLCRLFPQFWHSRRTFNTAVWVKKMQEKAWNTSISRHCKFWFLRMRLRGLCDQHSH